MCENTDVKNLRIIPLNHSALILGVCLSVRTTQRLRCCHSPKDLMRRCPREKSENNTSSTL